MSTANSTNHLTLYHYWRSSCSWRVRWALKHKGVPYSEVIVNLLTGEQSDPAFLAKNPGGYVPALDINGEVFGESLAILEWIEETYPANPLLPKAPRDRLRVRQMCHLIVSGIQPLQNLAVMRRVSNDPAEQIKWAHDSIKSGLVKLEQLVAPYAGTYSFGGHVTLADLCLVPQVYNAARFQVDMTPFPTISRINKACLTLPACDAAAPHNQAGATP